MLPQQEQLTLVPSAIGQSRTASQSPGSVVCWWASCVALVCVGYWRFFAGTYFSQDDFVWLYFSKFHPFPIEVLWTDALCGQFFRPLGQLWWVAIHSIAGNRLEAYQIAFLLMHLLNGFLVSRIAGRIHSPAAGRLAFPLFVMNPLFVSRISPYYCFIFDTLGFFFFATTILLICRGNDTGCRRVMFMSLLTANASYFTKEAFYTLPAVLVLVLGVIPNGVWNWHTLYRMRRWLALHGLVWAGALIWRSAMIGGLGGYGLVHVRTFSDVCSHLAERAATLGGFVGWSCSPHLARWDRTEMWTLLVTAGVFLLVSIWASWIRLRPGIWWIWTWIAITWSPSVFMTTYAPVSFYTPLVGTVLLISGLFTQYQHAKWCVLFLTAYFAVSANLYYSDRTPAIRELRLQQQKLLSTFADLTQRTRPGDRMMLLRGHLDLTPDPMIKYHLSPNARVPDVIFVNTQFPIAWIISEAPGPQGIRPMRVSPDFQSGSIIIGHAAAVPLSYRGVWWQIVAHGPPYRYFKWTGADWVEISPEKSQVGTSTN